MFMYLRKKKLVKALAAVFSKFAAKTSLLLKSNGVNNAQNNTFLDSSANNLAITNNGAVTQGSFSPFSSNGYSVYFNGAGNQSLTTSSTITLSASYTIEFWLNLKITTSGGLFAIGNWGSGINLYLSAGTVTSFSSNIPLNNNTAIANNTWNHVAYVRNGNNLAVYLNGYNVASYSGAVPNNPEGAVSIGGFGSAGYCNGSLSNLRVVDGSALYTANFTPPTAPLTAIVGTSLLCLQSNSFKDNSSNKLSLTPVDTPSVQPRSPFSNVVYSPALHGGSSYFNGSSYLTTPNNSNCSVGTGAFTYECWIYQTTRGSISKFIGNTGAGSTAIFMFININGKVNITTLSNGYGTSTTTITLNCWAHIALSYSGSGQLMLFINGVRDMGNIVPSQIYNLTDSQFSIGGDGTYKFIGYISSARLVKGAAVYTTNFTPPTTPLAPIANSSVLLNCTNAGIYDATSGMDIITVGTAKVSTSVTKFNTSNMYFNGSTDYVSMPNSSQFDLSSGDFTIEAWINTSNSAAGVGICGSRPTSAASGWCLRIATDASVHLCNLSGGWFDQKVHSTLISSNTWHHIAITKVGTVYTCFVNGSGEVISGITAGLAYLPALPLVVGADSSDGEAPFLGYIEDFRITKAVVYTGNFTPPTTTLPTNTDPYFNQVSLLLDGEGPNDAQNNTFIDSSPNNLAIIRTGAVTQGSFSPFNSNGWSGYFPSGSNLSTVYNVDFNLPGAFTIETWVNPSSNTFTLASRSADYNSGQTEWSFAQNPVNGWGLYFYVGAYGNYQTELYTGVTLPLNTWSHVAVTRNASNVWEIFIDGIAVTTYIYSQNSAWNAAATLTNSFDLTYCAGAGSGTYFSNFRLVKGTAVYTTNFTPSKVPLTAVTGTLLLTCQDSSFKDNSGNNKVVAITGAALIKSKSPFSNVVYSPELHGGSAYLDGTSYLVANTVPQLGTTDWTIELFLNPVSQAADTGFFQLSGVVGGFQGGAAWLNSIAFVTANQKARVYINSGAYSSTTSTVLNNSWQHIAIVKFNNAIRIYFNGNLDISFGTLGELPDSHNYTCQSLVIGGGYSTNYLTNTYISNFRIVAGTALYTANFTPPTEPSTAITNTTFLLDAANAGITDSSSNIDVTTVGTAKISTTQKKFGTSSMYFDGSAGCYLKLPAGSLNFSASDFTIDFWYYKTSQAPTGGRLFQTADGDSITAITIQDNAGILNLGLSSNGSTWDILGATACGTLVLSSWQHIVVRRIGSTFTVFLNGILTSTFTSTAALFTSTAQTPIIGGQLSTSGNRTVIGYIDDFRITLGKGRYTCEPTAALAL